MICLHITKFMRRKRWILRIWSMFIGKMPEKVIGLYLMMDSVQRFLKGLNIRMIGGLILFIFVYLGVILCGTQNTTKFNVKGRVTPHTLKGNPYMSGAKKQEKMKNLAMCYAQTMNKDLAIDLAFGSMTDKQHLTWKRRMKTEDFRDMVRDELQKLLNEHGYTADWTMELFGEAIEMAKNKNDTSNLMRAVENLQDMHGMKEKHLQKTTTQIEAVSTSRMLEEIQEEEKKLKATQIVEKEVDKKTDN